MDNNDTIEFFCKANIYRVRRTYQDDWQTKARFIFTCNERQSAGSSHLVSDLLAIFFYAVFGADTLALAAKTGQSNHLHIFQTHSVLGPIELIASPNISLMQLRKLEYSIYFDARKNSVLVVAPAKKLFYKSPLQKFEYGLSSTLDTITDMDLSPKAWKHRGKTRVWGVEADNYLYVSKVDSFSRGLTYMPGKKGVISVESLITTMQSALAPKQLCQLLTRMEHVPPVGGIPLSMKTSYDRGYPRVNLNTIKVSIQPMEEVKLPQLNGFKEVKKSSEIFYGQLNGFDNLLGK